LPDKITKYLEANDNADDYAESLLDDLEQKRLEDIDDLYNNTDDRDLELWAYFGLEDPDQIVVEYEAVESDDRDLDWVIGLAGLATAASIQFFLDNREETLIKPLAYREQALDPFQMSYSELVLAGKRKTEIEAVMRFQALQAKYLEEVSFLRGMGNRELYDALREYGALRPFEQSVSRATGYVSRMTTYRPGSPEFKAAVNQLIDADSKRAVTGMNRRSVERIYTYREADGDLNTLMVWIGEPGPHNCQFCPSFFGETDTYGNWIERGLPGDVCEGLDYCKCHLAAA
jgi:hypothetical protein